MPRRRPLFGALALVAASFLLVGCARKAPGPDECREFAYLVYNVGKSARLEQVREDVDELTRECLVTPYDREYLRCVEESGNLRRCQVSFLARKRAN